MSTSLARASALAIVILLPACTTTTVTKVTDANPNEPGLRYSLPKPYILVIPNGDGTLTVQTLYAEDPNNTYAVVSKSFMAKHKLNITLRDGQLKEVTTQQDNTAAVASLAKTTGEVSKSMIEAGIARRNEGRVAAAAKDKAVGEKKLALKLAQIDLRAASETGNPEKIAAAQVAVEKAEATLNAANSFLAPETELIAHDAPGPMLFAVNETDNGPELVAVKFPGNLSQKTYQTLVAKKKKEAASTPDVSLSFKDDKDVFEVPIAGGTISFTLLSSTKLDKIGKAKLTPPADFGNPPVPTVEMKLDATKEKIEVKIENIRVSKSRYILSVPVQAPGGQPTGVELKFVVKEANAGEN